MGRLRWRCRRGMRELDVLLVAWLDSAYASAPKHLQAQFSHLLAQEDDQIWDWLLGRAEPQDLGLRAIVRAIIHQQPTA